MQNKPKRPSLIVLVGLPLAVIVLLWSVLNPPSSAPKAGAKGTTPTSNLTYAQAIQKQGETMRNLTDMQAKQEKIPGKIAAMAYTMPAEQLRPRIIRDLLAVANKAKVHLTEFKSLRPQLMASRQVARVPLEVRFRAAFQPNVVQFLYYLEDPKNKIVVDKLNVTSAQNRFQTVDVSAQISVFTRSTIGVGAEGENSNAVASADRG